MLEEITNHFTSYLYVAIPSQFINGGKLNSVIKIQYQQRNSIRKLNRLGTGGRDLLRGRGCTEPFGHRDS